MKKKLICTLLCLALCLSLLPMAALATEPVETAEEEPVVPVSELETEPVPETEPVAETEPAAETDPTLEQPGIEKLFVGNVEVVKEYALVQAADENGTWTYDMETNTLTLKGADITETERYYGIEARGDLNLVLENDNTIHCASYYGIYVSGTLTITGSGSLTADGSDFGIATGKALNIGDRVTISAASGAVTSGSSYGIKAGDGVNCLGVVTISDYAKVTAIGGTAPDKSYGLYSDDTVTISGNAQLTTTADEGLNSYGIYALSAVVLNDCAKVTTTGDSNVGGYGGSYGIRTTRMIINNGSLTAVSAPSLVASVGIYCSRFECNGGIVTARGSDSETDGSWGIAAHNNVNINGGMITAISGNAASSSCGFQMSDNSGSTCLMAVNGGTITAKSGSAGQTLGLDASALTINNGFITATAGQAEDFSWGIRVASILTVNGGTIIATGNSASMFSYGILASSDSTIDSATVTATGNSASSSYGIRTFGALSISNSIVTALSGKAKTESCGIVASFGNLNIVDSFVTATAGEAELSDGIACPDGEYTTSGGKIIETNVSEIIEQSKEILSYWKDKFKPVQNNFPAKFPTLWKDFFRK